MRTVKQVSDLTGISVRMLHYYDEIGLLKPSEITEAGYRLYDDEALETLQQILFFKELDIPLKEVKEIMLSPYFDKMQALKNQKKLIRNMGNGAFKFIGEALKNYLGDNQPKLKTLYEKLTSDLSKDHYSKEIQAIVEEIANETKKQT